MDIILAVLTSLALAFMAWRELTARRTTTALEEAAALVARLETARVAWEARATAHANKLAQRINHTATEMNSATDAFLKEREALQLVLLRLANRAATLEGQHREVVSRLRTEADRLVLVLQATAQKNEAPRA